MLRASVPTRGIEVGEVSAKPSTSICSLQEDNVATVKGALLLARSIEDPSDEAFEASQQNYENSRKAENFTGGYGWTSLSSDILDEYQRAFQGLSVENECVSTTEAITEYFSKGGISGKSPEQILRQ